MYCSVSRQMTFSLALLEAWKHGFNQNCPSRQSSNAHMASYLQTLPESVGENLPKLWFTNKPMLNGNQPQSTKSGF